MQPKTSLMFFVDAMLGNIAKKLRLMGFDTRYVSDIKDESLMQVAVKENRTVISKDKDLVRISHKNNLNAILIHEEKEIDQLHEIMDFMNLKIIEINGDGARCPNCNSKTETLDKKNINQNVPEKVLENNEKFWICKNCNQIFWEGTHIQNLQKLVKNLNET